MCLAITEFSQSVLDDTAVWFLQWSQHRLLIKEYDSFITASDSFIMEYDSFIMGSTVVFIMEYDSFNTEYDSFIMEYDRRLQLPYIV